MNLPSLTRRSFRPFFGADQDAKLQRTGTCYVPPCLGCGAGLGKRSRQSKCLLHRKVPTQVQSGQFPLITGVGCKVPLGGGAKESDKAGQGWAGWWLTVHGAEILKAPFDQGGVVKEKKKGGQKKKGRKISRPGYDSHLSISLW